MTCDPLEELRNRIQCELDAFIAEQAPVIAAVDADCGELTRAITDLVAGGKRMRPAFLRAGWAAAAPDGADDTPAIRAGAALELFQAAALLHDDLIDNSDTRRGRPAAHRRIQAWHTAHGWLGSGADFGRGGAILAGDLSLLWARELMSRAVRLVPGVDAHNALHEYDQMSFQLMGGQFLDMLTQVRPPAEDPIEQARRVIAHKTTQYTVVRPLRIGAAMAGAPPQTLAALQAYGTPLGEAFQLRDDLLGVFGDPARTGKPAGDDLREGKRTILLELARRSGAQAATVLDELVGRPDLDDTQIETLRVVIRESGAVASLERLIRTRQQDADAALASAGFEAGAVSALQGLSDLAVRRTR